MERTWDLAVGYRRRRKRRRMRRRRRKRRRRRTGGGGHEEEEEDRRRDSGERKMVAFMVFAIASLLGCWHLCWRKAFVKLMFLAAIVEVLCLLFVEGVTQPASLILGLLLRVAHSGKPVSHSIMAMTNVADG